MSEGIGQEKKREFRMSDQGMEFGFGRRVALVVAGQGGKNHDSEIIPLDKRAQRRLVSMGGD